MYSLARPPDISSKFPLKNEFGIVGATIIELGSLGNADLMVFFFAFLGAFKIHESSRGRKTSEWVATAALVSIYTVFAALRGIFRGPRSPSLHTIFVAAFSAEAIFLLGRLFLCKLVCGRAFRINRLLLHAAAFVIAALVSLLLSRILAAKQQRPNSFALGVFLVAAAVALGLVHLSSISPQMKSLTLREASFAAWSLPIVLVLIFPDLVVLIRFSESLGVIGKLCPLISFRFLVGEFAKSTFNVDESLPMGVICASIYYFVSGNIDEAARIYGLHPVGLFVSLLVLADILRVSLTFGFRRSFPVRDTQSISNQQHVWQKEE